MMQADIHTETISAQGVEEALRLLQSRYPGVSILPGPGGGLQFELRTDYLDGLVTHQLSTPTGIKFRFAEQFDGYLLAILDEGGLDLETGGKWLSWRAPACVMVDARRASRWRWHAGRYEMVLVDATRMHTRLSQLLERPVPQRIRFQLDAPADAPGLRFAREIVGLVRTRADGDAYHDCGREVLRNLQDAVMYLILEAIPSNYSAYMAPRPTDFSPKHVRRAMDYMHANARSAITLDEIARTASVSVRALQAGFSRFKGLTPTAYLKQVRLAGVHAALSSVSDARPIGEIARHWRFAHLGQFAKDYRKAFGQSPSETRRAARASGDLGHDEAGRR